ncbi:MAG: UDP-N-acetylmuramate dehydrogenase [Lachnospiraceae bacterium]|nr:UDP-N-acetylmuramate dehydrogenase [Lachnospiraceae bacterium]
MKNLMEKLCSIVGAQQIRINEPMSRHTTFRTGGPADYYVEPEDVQALSAVLKLCRAEKEPYYILGNGSNLLVGDGGYRGVMIALGKAWSSVTVEESRIRAGAGALLSAVSRQALEHALTGLEFAAGIPGTVGGAVVMNAGAYGSEMKQVLTAVTVLTEAGEIRTLPASELELGYRTSCILRRGYVVLEAKFALTPGDETEIRGRMDDLAQQRKSKQPLEYPSAGSTFKRPEGYFAGKLIQDAGLRGYCVGGAQVSEKHCGFVINRGEATAADIMELCRQVQEKVQEQFGVTLELEVKTLGEF